MTDLTGKTIAITGGTGSFGSTMVRHLLAQDVAQVHVLSRDEAKQDEMRKRFNDGRLKLFLGDVRDAHSVEDAFVGADYVFHAAALKQVPSCEFFPDQAVRTNIDGSNNVLRAASRAGVRSVVCLSTDKAVYPVNAMGMTKALMEKSAQAFARNNPDSPSVVSTTRWSSRIERSQWSSSVEARLSRKSPAKRSGEWVVKPIGRPPSYCANTSSTGRSRSL